MDKYGRFTQSQKEIVKSSLFGSSYVINEALCSNLR